MLKLIIADDEEIIRDRLINKIPWNTYGFEIVGEAENGKELYEMTKLLRPDVVMLDIKMPIMDGIEYTRQIRQEGFDTEIVVLSGYGEFEYARAFINLGIFEYMLKPLNKKDIGDVFKRLRYKLENRRTASNMFKREFDMDNLIVCSSEMENALVKSLRTANYDGFVATVESMFDLFEKCTIEYSDVLHNMFYMINYLYRYIRESNKHNESIKETFKILITNCDKFQNASELKKYVTTTMKIVFDVLAEKGSSKTLSSFDKALKYIEDHYMEEITLEKVAEHIGVSCGYLSSIFKKENDVSFVTHLRNRRIKEAIKLLTTTEKKVYEVAENCGFQTPRYFSEIFKSAVGMTPLEYRRMHKKG